MKRIHTTVVLPEAVILLGPSGSGKTPLGRILEETGVAGGRRVFHFDFGACLRSANAHPESWPCLTASDSEIIRRSLETGSLLEDSEFHLALKILQTAAEKRNTDDALIVLNGIPRHLGQAAFLEPLLRVIEIVFLECPPSVLSARIRGNSGGDRTGRPDDAEEAVSRRWMVFEERTRPLLDHYASKGIRIIRIPVSSEDTGESLFEKLHQLTGTPVTSR
jgi:adenylate kinase